MYRFCKLKECYLQFENKYEEIMDFTFILKLNIFPCINIKGSC